MKKLLLALWLCASTVWGGAIIENRDDFQDYVRQITGLESTALMPDTTLNAIIQEAVLWTSVECGGVEAQYRILTVAGQAWYDVPDSVTEILYATLLSKDRETYSVKAYYPQWFGDTESPSSLGDEASDETEDDFPFGYNYWADTLQLFPIPNRVDTLVLKCYIEHPIFQGTDSTNDTLQFKPPYTSAAIDLAASEALYAVEMFDKSALWFAKYERKRNALRGIYQRKFDIIQSTKE